MSRDSHIELRNLSKRFPSGGSEITVLDRVNLVVGRGETVAIIGPSGSGKSSLLALIAGLDRPSAGDVMLDGVPIQNRSEDELALLRRRHIGFVFQSFQLLGNLTARENVLLPLELAELEGADDRVDRLLEDVGLADRGHHYPAQISGGEQQRVALARAFATEPPILLADEPTGNLDRETGKKILATLKNLREKGGTTLVLVTHDPAVARIADRVVNLSGGRLEDARRGDLA